ncbi:phytanoyl-CoA dioxygenase family protein [Sphaerisporangium sp. B11E5]|uniref:phytanoyl-CoA dioxygenase family protein n=1 Tax=Sphaerisporangium sp. B11E5 TaxID=3153563 RepID=UPI00325CB4C8
MTLHHEFMLNDEEMALLPTGDDVRFYREHGWYLSNRLFSDEEIDEVGESIDRFYAGYRDRNLPRKPPAVAYWEPEHGDVQRHNDYIHYENATVRRILCKPLMGAVAARLMESSEARIWSSTLIYKPARGDESTNVVPWHIDLHHWQVCTSENLVTAFIPMHDCLEEHGTIRVIDGSRRWKDLPSEEDDDETQHFANRRPDTLERSLARNAEYNNAELRKISIEIDKGRVSFHHCRTYHGSGPNVSGESRRVVTVRFQDRDNEYREFRRPSGEKVVYSHDDLVRRTADNRPDYSDPDYCPVVWRESLPPHVVDRPSAAALGSAGGAEGAKGERRISRP